MLPSCWAVLSLSLSSVSVLPVLAVNLPPTILPCFSAWVSLSLPHTCMRIHTHTLVYRWCLCTASRGTTDRANRP